MAISLQGNSKSTFTGEIASAKNFGTGGTKGEAQIVGYQQGTWTPVSDNGTINTVYGLQWWRIGNSVTIQGQLSNFSSSNTVPIYVTGFPYKPDVDAVGAVMTTYFGNPPNASHISRNSTGMLSFFMSGPNKAEPWSLLQYDYAQGANSSIWFSATYQTADTTWNPSNGATVS